MSDDDSRQIRSVTDPLTQLVAHLWELMRELKNEQVNGRHEETDSFKAASSTSGIGNRSDISSVTPFTFNKKVDFWYIKLLTFIHNDSITSI